MLCRDLRYKISEPIAAVGTLAPGPGDQHTRRDGKWWSHIVWMPGGDATHCNVNQCLGTYPDLLADIVSGVNASLSANRVAQAQTPFTRSDATVWERAPLAATAGDSGPDTASNPPTTYKLSSAIRSIRKLRPLEAHPQNPRSRSQSKSYLVTGHPTTLLCGRHCFRPHAIF
jgi:hypothetical protein